MPIPSNLWRSKKACVKVVPLVLCCVQSIARKRLADPGFYHVGFMLQVHQCQKSRLDKRSLPFSKPALTSEPISFPFFARLKMQRESYKSSLQAVGSLTIYGI